MGRHVVQFRPGARVRGLSHVRARADVARARSSPARGRALIAHSLRGPAWLGFIRRSALGGP
jgi:hypothetical protein